MQYTIKALEDLICPESVVGNYCGNISRIAALEKAGAGDVSFLGNRKYRPQVENCRASLLFLPLDFAGQPRENQVYFRVKNPSWALELLCRDVEMRENAQPLPGIHATAVIGRNVKLGAEVYLGPHCVLEDNVALGDRVFVGPGCILGRDSSVGDDCRLIARVTLYPRCELGERVIIQAGAVIGSDGYGYETSGSVHRKLTHLGRVILEDDVEIGANCAIDRARFDSTRIGKGSKVDNLVQIGHNVRIGEGCLIVSQCGLAGSCSLGNGVILAGQVGIAGHIHIGDGAQIGAQSGTARDVSPGSLLRGTPVMSLHQANRFYILREKIPELFRRMETLEKNAAAK